MPECVDCIYKDRIDRIEGDVKELQREHTSSHSKLIETTTKLDILIKTVNENKNETKQALKDLEIAITDLSQKPSKRWDIIVNTAVAGIVSALVGAMMALIIIN